ncbi:MAG: hypothetical protein JSW07_21340 [bacterium]|nr:MAG: hypothetical protein JSW07_21340 [bacterium]
MKIHELLYIIGIFLIIVLIAIYALSTTMISNPEDGSISDLFGRTTEIDTNFTTEEALSDLRAEKRHGNLLLLWIGIPLGIGVLLAGIIIKRMKEGRDLFIDDEIEDDEESDFVYH